MPGLGQRGSGGGLSQLQIVVCDGGGARGFVGLFVACCRAYFPTDVPDLGKRGSGGGDSGGGGGLSQLQTVVSGDGACRFAQTFMLLCHA